MPTTNNNQENNMMGMQVVSNNSGLFHMYVYVPSGAIYETKKISGISHFLEHMLFKNKGAASNISKMLSSIGGQYNATTSKDVTCFYVETHMRHYKMAIDLIHQISRNISFGKQEFSIEKKVVLEELAQTVGSFQNIIWDMTNKTIFDKKNVYNNSIIGTRKTVGSLSYNEVKEYAKSRYTQCTVMMNCDARIKNKALKYMCERFGIDRYAGTNLIEIHEPHVHFASLLVEPKLIFVYEHSQQFVTCMTFATMYHGGRTDNIILKFVQFILTSSGLNSLLNEKIRVQRGLVYTVSSILDTCRYNGTFYIQFSSNSSKTDYIINLILEVLYQLKSKGLTPSQFDFFKKAFIDWMFVSLSDESARTDMIGTYAFYGLNMTDKDIHKFINKMTNDDIKRVAKEALDFKRMGIVSIGKYADVDAMAKNVENILETYEETLHGSV